MWTYPRVRTWEYVATGVTAVGALALDASYTDTPEPSWHGGLLFDNAVRSALAARSVEGRERAAKLSNPIWHITQIYPLVDSVVVPLVWDNQNFDVAWQLTMINLQVASVAFLLTRAPHNFVRRGRPALQECSEDDISYSSTCRAGATGTTASFVSGHTSMAFAAAGAICMHHSHLPLYGGNIADDLACGFTLASASTVGVLRIISDLHWSTDVLAGAAVGLGTGLGIPFLLHYGSAKGADDDPSKGAIPWNVALIPIGSDDRVGVMLTGYF